SRQGDEQYEQYNHYVSNHKHPKGSQGHSPLLCPLKIMKSTSATVATTQGVITGGGVVALVGFRDLCAGVHRDGQAVGFLKEGVHCQPHLGIECLSGIECRECAVGG